jgi:hypothetical protein
MTFSVQAGLMRAWIYAPFPSSLNTGPTAIEDIEAINQVYSH